MTTKFDATILGGLPVVVEINYTGRRDYEVNQITWNSGHQIPQSVYDRMSDRDWGSIYDAANEVVA